MYYVSCKENIVLLRYLLLILNFQFISESTDFWTVFVWTFLSFFLSGEVALEIVQTFYVRAV
jgi:hypothetical protein